MIARALLAAVLAALATAAPAAMYKWVDEKGVTHYTEEPPHDRKSTRIDIAPSGPVAAPPQTADKWRAQEMEERKQRVEKDQVGEKEKAMAQGEAVMRGKRCALAKRQVASLAPQAPVKTEDKGEKALLDEKERGNALERYQKDVAANCDTK